MRNAAASLLKHVVQMLKLPHIWILWTHTKCWWFCVSRGRRCSGTICTPVERETTGPDTLPVPFWSETSGVSSHTWELALTPGFSVCLLCDSLCPSTVSNKWIHERGQEFRRRCGVLETDWPPTPWLLFVTSDVFLLLLFSLHAAACDLTRWFLVSAVSELQYKNADNQIMFLKQHFWNHQEAWIN